MATDLEALRGLGNFTEENMPNPLYGLKDTPTEMAETFKRADNGRATKSEYVDKRSFIDQKKADIRTARLRRNMDGYKGRPRPTDQLTFEKMTDPLHHGRKPDPRQNCRGKYYE